MFLPGDDNTNEIRQLISCSKEIDCAVAFLGQEAEQFFETASGGRIVCNLKSGGTNPHVVEQLIDKGVIDVRSHPLLHAKVYIGTNKAIVSSANLSANGLGLEAQELAGWVEAGYKVTDQQELQSIQNWFSKLWDDSKEITDDDIKMAMEAWKKRQIVRPTTDASKSLLQALRKNPRELEYRNIYLVVMTEFHSDEATQALKEEVKYLKQKKKKDGHNADAWKNWDAYEDWSNLPENSNFIDLSVGPRGEIKYHGLFKSPDKQILVSFKNKDGEESELNMCYKQNDIFGYVVKGKDIVLLMSKAAELLKSKIGVGTTTCKYIPLTDARNILFRS